MSVLDLFTIYENPSDWVADYAPFYVVRRSVVGEESGPREARGPYPSISDARAAIPLGLVCVGRSMDDDASIVETWL